MYHATVHVMEALIIVRLEVLLHIHITGLDQMVLPLRARTQQDYVQALIM